MRLESDAEAGIGGTALLECEALAESDARRSLTRSSPRFDRIFLGEAMNPFFGDQNARFSGILSHISIGIFDAE